MLCQDPPGSDAHQGLWLPPSLLLTLLPSQAPPTSSPGLTPAITSGRRVPIHSFRRAPAIRQPQGGVQLHHFQPGDPSRVHESPSLGSHLSQWGNSTRYPGVAQGGRGVSHWGGLLGPGHLNSLHSGNPVPMGQSSSAFAAMVLGPQHNPGHPLSSQLNQNPLPQKAPLHTQRRQRGWKCLLMNCLL